MEAAVITPARGTLPRGSGPRFADPLLQGVLAAIAAGVLVLIGFFFVKLIIESKPAFDAHGRHRLRLLEQLGAVARPVRRAAARRSARC